MLSFKEFAVTMHCLILGDIGLSLFVTLQYTYSIGYQQDYRILLFKFDPNFPVHVHICSNQTGNFARTPVT